MHSEPVIEPVWRCTEAEIEWTQRCTWWPWSIKIGGVVGGGWSGGDQSEGGQSGGSESGGGRSGGMCNGSWDSIHWLTRNIGNVKNWVQHGLPRAERLAGSGRHSIVGWCSTWCMQYSVYTVLGVCSTWCMLYLVYAVPSPCCTRCELLIMTWRHREGWFKFVFLGDGRVEDEKERDERRWGKNHQKLGLKSLSCESQFSNPDTAGSSSDLACHNTDTSTAQPTQASPTPHFSYLLVSSTLFSSSSPITLILFRNFYPHRRTQSLLIPLYLSMPWSWVDTEYKHTPSTAYTMYSIPKIVCLPLILMITGWSLNIASATSMPPYAIYCHQPACSECSKVKSPCNIPTFASQWTDI